MSKFKYLLGDIKCSKLYCKMESAKWSAGDKVNTIVKTAGTLSTVNSTINAAKCATAVVTGTIAGTAVAPAAAIAGTAYYAGKAVVTGSLVKAIDDNDKKKKEEKKAEEVKSTGSKFIMAE